MRWRLHVIGASLSMVLVILAGAPLQVQGQADLQQLQQQLIQVRRDRAQIDAEWAETVRKLAAQLAQPPPPRSIAYSWTAPRFRPARLPRTGIWSAEAEKARQDRREWIESELKRRSVE